MKSPALIVNILAVFFLVLGMTWYLFIQARYGRFVQKQIVSGVVKAAPVSAPVIKVRSPFAKPYHDAIFWTICAVELGVSMLYFLSGLFLLKRYVLAKFFVWMALGADLFLKMSVILFMKFGAIPLSQLTHNPNLLQLYFMPDDKLHSLFAAVVSGLKFYLPGGFIYLMTEFIYFMFCFYFFSRREVKDYLRAGKKV